MSRPRPLISLVTPLYNHRPYVEHRVKSILAQSLTDFEWIVIDDASTDGSREWFADLTAGDRRVSLASHHVNAGMRETVNEAIGRSVGKYVVRAESDDACAPQFLERLSDALEANAGARLAYAKTLSMDAAGRVRGGHRQRGRTRLIPGPVAFHELLKGNFVPGPSIMFERSLLASTGPFGVPPIMRACDWHFALRCASVTDFVYVAEPISFHRRVPGSLNSVGMRCEDVAAHASELTSVVDDALARASLPDAQQSRLRHEAFRSLTLGPVAAAAVKAASSGNIRAMRWKWAEALPPSSHAGLASWYAAVLRTCVIACGRKLLHASTAWRSQEVL